MKEFWTFFLGGNEDLALTLLLLLAGLLASVLFTYFEYRIQKAAWLFIAANALTASALAIAFLVLGVSLSVLLAAFLLMLFVRVIFIYRKERDAS